jgi:hypothetical protein
MKDLNVRRIEMCARVVGFFISNPMTFSKGSPGPQLVKALADAVANINRLATIHTSELATARASSAARLAANKALIEALGKISRCAQGMAPTLPGVGDKFRPPTGSGASKLLMQAKAYAEEAAPLRDAFVKFEMAPRFIDDLNAKIEALEKAIGQRAVCKGAHVATSGRLNATMKIALGILVQLDPIVENKLTGDPHELSRWKTARHLERAWVSKRAVVPVPAKPDVPAAA